MSAIFVALSQGRLTENQQREARLLRENFETKLEIADNAKARYQREKNKLDQLKLELENLAFPESEHGHKK